MIAFILISFIVHESSATQIIDTKVKFITSFIQNEGKPTHLMFDVCWSKSAKVQLVKQASSMDVRSTESLQPSKLLDQGLLFLVDLDCTDAVIVLSRAQSQNLFRAPYRWLVLSNLTDGKGLLQEYPLFADSDLVLAEWIGFGYRMTELHKPGPQGRMQATLRGFYNGSFNDIRPHRSLFRRRQDLMGHPLTKVIVIQDSNNSKEHLDDRLEPQHDYIAKLSWHNVRLGLLMLNATPAYTWAYRWGYPLNGSWSGMVADLEAGRGDVGTNCLLTAPRLAVVTYTDNMAPFRVRFIFRQPPLAYVTNIFRLPFSSNVWVALAVCTAASTIATWAALRWEVKHEQISSHIEGGIGDALLVAMGALSQQGCTIEPKKASGRIMIWILFTTLLALYAAYSANIVVLLQAPSTTIRSLGQLAHSKLVLAANDVDYNHLVLKLYAKDPLRQEIYKRIDPDKGKKQYYELNEGVQKIRQGLFAFHSIVEPVYRRIEDTFMEHEKCDLMEVDFLGEYDGFTPVYKHSPYLELLRVVFKRIQESGIKAVLTRRHQTPKPRCEQKGTMFSSVGLRDLAPVLLLMLYGTALAILTLLAELTLFKRIQESGIKAVLTRRHQTPKPRCEQKGTMFSSVGLRDLAPVLLLMLYGTALAILTLLAELTLYALCKTPPKQK